MLAAVKIALLVLAGLALAAPATAGRTHYGWINGTEVMPERGVELDTWLADLDNVSTGVSTGTSDADERDETQLGWAATIGITDRLELALPIELSWTRSGETPGETQLDRWGAEVRYRLASPDPVEAPALVPLARVAVKRAVADRRAVDVEAELTLSYERGCVHATLSVAGRRLLRDGRDATLVRPAGGLSVALTGELRAGVEAVSGLSPRGPDDDWVAVGPNLAWTHGRFWLAISAPIGLSNIDSAARIRWGIAL
jgi:hypothetical protein